jgi:cyclic lactone autoinducer peptide
MHYKNGRNVQLNDKVIGVISGLAIIGVVAAMSANATACNIQVYQPEATPITGAYGVGEVVCQTNPDNTVDRSLVQSRLQYGTASDFLHVEDAQKALVALETLAPELVSPPVQAAAPVAAAPAPAADGQESSGEPAASAQAAT